MDNLDDIAKKYRDEIVNLYKGHESEYIPDLEDKETVEEVPEKTDSEEENKTGRNIPMPPAISEPLIIYDKSEYMGNGYLIVEVKSGNGAFPIDNAVVIITENVNGQEKAITILVTDDSGRTEVTELPAPVKNGTEISDTRPYSYYNVIVYKDLYYEVQNKNIAVFSGITSLLPVNLIPLPAYTDSNQVMTFYEEEADL